MGVSDKAAIVLQILNETATLFERKDVPFSNVRGVLEYIYYVHDQLKPCLQSKTSLPLMDSPIEDCFKKLQLFLNDGSSHCTWQVAREDVMVVFQQLELDISASRHRQRRTEVKNLLLP
ncbi:UCL51438.1interferon-upsilon [Podarcis lilfordi]|uniref:UCL51438.1interferon-upsilon n=1 Tax=Podarcis lilfordi TaxID=74358 RepID=A0AA35L369_9SAUR|nr:UCL51438.1interferon-upsilon [Podarcis lilfordi]